MQKEKFYITISEDQPPRNLQDKNNIPGTEKERSSPLDQDESQDEDSETMDEGVNDEGEENSDYPNDYESPKFSNGSIKIIPSWKRERNDGIQAITDEHIQLLLYDCSLKDKALISDQKKRQYF